MSILCTNQKSAPALRGQSGLVTLDASESLSVLPQLTLGDQCRIDGNDNMGAIDWIDSYGHSFAIKPLSMVHSMESQGLAGYLAEGQSVIIGE